MFVEQTQTEGEEAVKRKVGEMICDFFGATWSPAAEVGVEEEQ